MDVMNVVRVAQMKHVLVAIAKIIVAMEPSHSIVIVVMKSVMMAYLLKQIVVIVDVPAQG